MCVCVCVREREGRGGVFHCLSVDLVIFYLVILRGTRDLGPEFQPKKRREKKERFRSCLATKFKQ